MTPADASSDTPMAAPDRVLTPPILSSQIDFEELERDVVDGWLRRAHHPQAELSIYNYTERCQYEKAWTPLRMACRGLIVDGNGDVVSRPFGKFFNHGDPVCPPLPAHQHHVVTDKIDGSLGILYYLGGNPYIASRGSFVSEQAKIGTALLQEYYVEHRRAETLLFEIVYPENRIVVDYGECEELVLLAAISTETGLDAAALPGYDGPFVGKRGMLPIEDLQALAEPNSEGFVVSWPESGVRVKIKFDEYVRLHRVVSGINARRVWESLRAGDDLDALIEGVPDEVYEWVKRTKNEILYDYSVELNRASLVFSQRPEGADRRTLAEYFKDTGVHPAVLFKMLDDKPVEEMIWKAVEPESSTPRGALDA